MRKRITRRTAGAVVAAATVMLTATPMAGAVAPGTSRGPSTGVDPYVVPVNAANTQIQSLLSVADQNTTNGYPMPGIPDGLGAFADNGALTLLSSHEFGTATGLVRGTGAGESGFPGHGKRGALVAKYGINSATGEFVTGADFLQSAADLDFSGGYTGDFNRLCSGDLATPFGLFNAASGKGYNGRIFFAGEEGGPNGRLVGHDTGTGKAKVLPDLGQSSFENALTADTRDSDTVTIAENYDSGPGWNYVYVGAKKAQTGTLSNFDLAGLTGGGVYGVQVAGATQDTAGLTSSATGTSATYTGSDFRSVYGKNTPANFSLVALSSAGATTGSGATVGTVGATLQTDAKNKGAFLTDRTEDGAWDPQNPNDYYFVTTGSNPSTSGTGITNATQSDGRVLTSAGAAGGSATRSRGGLWRMRFSDRTNPTAGGTLTLLLDGNEANPLYMPDNLTVDSHGHILIQEDPGNIDYVARVWAYDIASGQLAPIATFDPAQFGMPSVAKSTTTSAAATNTATTISVADATGVTAPAIAKIGSEFLRITGVSGTTLTVVRGVGGSKASIASGASVKIYDPASNAGFLTNDEESSGIIEAEGLAGLPAGTFLLTAQVHSTNTPVSPMISTAAGKVGTVGSADADPNSYAVENGQYLKMTVDFAALFGAPPAAVPESPLPFVLPLGAVLVGAGFLLAQQRRRRNAVA